MTTTIRVDDDADNEEEINLDLMMKIIDRKSL
jgi:hypothetical protein